MMTGKPLGKIAMTATERQRKWRAKFAWQAGRNGPPVNKRLRLADLRAGYPEPPALH